MKRCFFLISIFLLWSKPAISESVLEDIAGEELHEEIKEIKEEAIDKEVQIEQLENAYYKKISEKDYTKEARIQALDKVTTHISTMVTPLEEAIRFRNLEITLLKCWKSPPEEEPENKALLSIHEYIPGEDKKEIFRGWIFSSSPAISTLEHPVYDITLLECLDKEEAKSDEENKEEVESSSEKTSETPPADQKPETVKTEEKPSDQE
jgi:hypothetical protein